MTTKMLRVTQTRSPIGRKRDQRATLIGLGLNKISRSKLVPDDPSTRGRIGKVRHLLEVEAVEADAATGTSPKAEQ